VDVITDLPPRGCGLVGDGQQLERCSSTDVNSLDVMPAAGANQDEPHGMARTRRFGECGHRAGAVARVQSRGCSSRSSAASRQGLGLGWLFAAVSERSGGTVTRRIWPRWR